MSADLIWLARAETHPQSIYDYISTDSPNAAESYVEDIVAACAKLRSFPSAGRKYDRRFRVLNVRNHLVFYHHDKTARLVLIAVVIDGRRDVAALLRDD